MGIPSFINFKKTIEPVATLPKHFNLAIDLATIMYGKGETVSEVVKNVLLVLQGAEYSTLIKKATQVFFTFDGKAPGQKLHEQFKRLQRKSMYKRFRMRDNLEELGSALTEALKSLETNYPVLFEFMASGEGECKAIAFNGFEFPQLPKLVLATDNDVYLNAWNIYKPYKRVIYDVYNIPKYEKGNRTRCIISRETEVRSVEFTGNYVPHVWYKYELGDGVYDFWNEHFPNWKNRWELVLAIIVLFGNDYVDGLLSGTKLQTLEILEKYKRLNRELPYTLDNIKKVIYEIFDHYIDLKRKMELDLKIKFQESDEMLQIMYTCYWRRVLWNFFYVIEIPINYSSHHLLHNILLPVTEILPACSYTTLAPKWLV